MLQPMENGPEPSPEATIKVDREEAIFNAARTLPVGDREAYLNAACGSDTALRERIQVLLDSHQEAGQFLEAGAPLRSQAQTMVASPQPSEKPGDVIAHYKIREQLGEGGCGVVYVAEQTEPVRRRVALKVIKLGMDTRRSSPGSRPSARRWR